LVFSYITNGQQILNANGWDRESDGTVEVAMYPRAGVDSTSESRSFGIKHTQSNSNTYLLNSGFRDNAETIKEVSTNQFFAFKVKCRAIEEDEDGNITNIRSLND
jgi:hypothetical protein